MLKNLSFRFQGDQWWSFTLRPTGEITVLAGYNSTGKTLMCESLMGIMIGRGPSWDCDFEVDGCRGRFSQFGTTSGFLDLRAKLISFRDQPTWTTWRKMSRTEQMWQRLDLLTEEIRETGPMLIIDDAFEGFDDENTARGMLWAQELAKTGVQVVLATGSHRVIDAVPLDHIRFLVKSNPHVIDPMHPDLKDFAMTGLRNHDALSILSEQDASDTLRCSP